MSRVTPVIQSDRFDPRKMTASPTSSGSPSLVTARPAFHLANTSGGYWRVCSVRIGPGAMAFT